MTTITIPNLNGPTSLIYTFCYAMPQRDAVPFYVGQSGRGLHRIGDYITATFGAPTDFRIGICIRLFQQHGATVTIDYEVAPDDKKDRCAIERQRINALMQGGIVLLNNEPSYNHKTASREQVMTRLRAFVLERVRA